MKAFALLAPCLALLCGCQENLYSKHYKSTESAAQLAPHTPPVKIVTLALGDIVATTKKYEARGYVVVGYSIFTMDTGDYAKSLAARAEDVQADVVLSGWSGAGLKHELVAVDSASPVGNNNSTSSGYVEEQGGRFATNSQSSPAKMANSDPGLTWQDVQQSNYSAVFLRRRADVPATSLGTGH